jgi:hypothetical protein
MAPRVFVSHASEDKERFVTSFAEQLRQNGIDAWLDKWEMLPGDSLVDKIIEEGLKEAQAVVVVLSKYSVNKPWVREELNLAFIKRINTGSKLIPVVIDDCEIPEVLKSTLWERVENLDSYQTSLDRIIASIFGVTDKPSLGKPPAYTQRFAESIGGLNKIDSLVLKLACESALANNIDFIDPVSVYLKDSNLDIPESELLDSMEILERQGDIQISRVLGGGLCHFRISTYGLEKYANACIPNYQGIVKDVVSVLVNKQLTDNHAVAAELNQPRLLIDHVFDVLESNGYIKQSKSIGGIYQVYNLSPALKRSLNG